MKNKTVITKTQRNQEQDTNRKRHKNRLTEKRLENQAKTLTGKIIHRNQKQRAQRNQETKNKQEHMNTREHKKPRTQETT